MRRHILIFCVTGLHTQHVSVISDQPPCALSKDLRILLGFRLYVHSFFYYVTFRNEMYSKVNKLVLILLITWKTVPLLCICQSLIYNHRKICGQKDILSSNRWKTNSCPPSLLFSMLYSWGFAPAFLTSPTVSYGRGEET